MRPILKPCLLAFFAMLAAYFVTSHAAVYPTIRQAYLDTLDKYLKQAPRLIDAKNQYFERRIAALDTMTPQQQMRTIAEIGEDYGRLSTDSAMSLYQRGLDIARKVGDNRYENKFIYRLSRFMPFKGLSREGLQTFKAARSSLDPRDQYDYYKTGHLLLYAIAEGFDVDTIRDRYINKAMQYSDSAARLAVPGSVEATFYRALPLTLTKEMSIAVAELTDVMARTDITDELFSAAAITIAFNAAKRGNVAEARYYAAMSMMSEVLAGSRYALGAQLLGHLIYEEEDYNRAFKYLTHALESSVASGSRIRAMEVSEILPMVVRTERALDIKRTDTLYILVTLLAIIVVIFAILLYYAYATRKSLKVARAELTRMNSSKDTYIRKLISLCGVYLTALENFNKLAARKIKVGQTSDLLSMIESGKIVREQLQNFYEVFDEAFLMVYPDFVERVNELMMPDRQLSLAEDGHLSTELRILAFMRLGADDSAQIAKFLGLSLNTVYTYRNKVKSRAVDRENFDKDIMNIRQTF